MYADVHIHGYLGLNEIIVVTVPNEPNDKLWPRASEL